MGTDENGLAEEEPVLKVSSCKPILNTAHLCQAPSWRVLLAAYTACFAALFPV